MTLETAESRQASKSICEFAAEHAFDLLVLGRHGQGGILHPKLGRIAQETARIARVPVLLVSAPYAAGRTAVDLPEPACPGHTVISAMRLAVNRGKIIPLMASTI